VVPAVLEKVANGKLTDEATLAFLLAGVDELIGAAQPRTLAVAA
jgi:hypothetical protein